MEQGVHIQLFSWPTQVIEVLLRQINQRVHRRDINTPQSCKIARGETTRSGQRFGHRKHIEPGFGR
jgi:hypothetical protein